MKLPRPRLVPLALLLLAAPALHAGETTSKVEAVTLYADRARVTRLAEADLPPGESVVEFTDLPLNLDEDTVQVSGTADGPLTILSSEIRHQFSAGPSNEEIKALQDKLRPLVDRLAEIADQREVLASQETYLRRILDKTVSPSAIPPNARNGDPAAPSAAPDLALLRESYALNADELGKIKTALRALAKEDEQTIAPEKTRLENEIARISSLGQKDSRRLVVAVRAEKAGHALLRAHYVMPGASWTPIYDARANTVTGDVSLEGNALIRQRTGEEWKDARLTLSTASPGRGGRMPEISPIELQITGDIAPQASGGFFGERDRARSQAPAMRNDIPMALSAAPANPAEPDELKPEVPADTALAAISATGLSVVYEIKLPATIPSDGETHKVGVFQRDFHSEFRYVATPRLQRDAFLLARLKNDSPAPILPGGVIIFRDGDMVGRSNINFVTGGAEFDLSIGIDDRMKVSWKQLVDKRGESGILTKSNVLTRKYETRLENFTGKPQKITIYDQLPVSKDNSLTIQNVVHSTAPNETQKETGKLTWEIGLDPKEEKVLTLDYDITWPKDKYITPF